MSVDERTRHEIHARFEEFLGPELAGAFMSYLPPVGWADVATKRDLDGLRTELRLDLAREVGSLETRMTDRMDRHFRTTIFALFGSNVTLVGLAFAAARLG